jgi:peptidylprolyl isomerase
MMMIQHRRLVLSASFLVALLAATTAAFSVGPKLPEINRRDAILATTAGLLAPLVVVAPPAGAALDLSQYQDGPKGLKYLVTQEGSGTVKPQRGQKVRTSYTLYLNGFAEEGGKKVDSSKGLLGDKPFEFNVGVSQVIKGWDLSLLDMVEGESRRLVVPSDLGYGDKGAGGSIPGGATLYFDVELTELGIKKEFSADQMKWLEDNPL